ncbi:hypothetical protein GZH53_03840 [Flavihumibacter sp. R14]|nr:hypothetical protein [Flavihumibacter soli]
MKNLIIILICLLAVKHSIAQEPAPNDQYKYFDVKGLQITKAKFEDRRKTNMYLDIPGDSANHMKLIERVETGQINDVKNLYELIGNTTGSKLDETKPLVIIYHPGPDLCNSGGSSSVEFKSKWFKELESGVFKITASKPVYIYKDEQGVERYKALMTWYKDPEGTIERLFFRYHYPCSSFTVIGKDGNYISYFGEFGKESVWAAAKRLAKPAGSK